MDHMVRLCGPDYRNNDHPDVYIRLKDLEEVVLYLIDNMSAKHLLQQMPDHIAKELKNFRNNCKEREEERIKIQKRKERDKLLEKALTAPTEEERHQLYQEYLEAVQKSILS